MEFCHATLEDVEKMVPLWESLMQFHIELDESFVTCQHASEIWKEFVSNNIQNPDNKVVLIAKNEGNVVGYIMGEISERPPVYEKKIIGNIWDIYVSEESRGKKVGKGLYDMIEAWFKVRNVKRIELNVATSNPQALEFWKNMGFDSYMAVEFKNL